MASGSMARSDPKRRSGDDNTGETYWPASLERTDLPDVLDLAALIAVYADTATAHARTGEVISPVSDFN
jgi:hypothetical protein